MRNMYIVYKTFDFAREAYALGGFYDIIVDTGEAARALKWVYWMFGKFYCEIYFQNLC
jgi:hypothetical protein